VIVDESTRSKATPLMSVPVALGRKRTREVMLKGKEGIFIMADRALCTPQRKESTNAIKRGLNMIVGVERKTWYSQS
jgi:hypothetical protein